MSKRSISCSTIARAAPRRWPRRRAISRRFSAAVRFLSSAANCPVSEITRRTRSASATTSCPAIRALPASGRSSVASIRTIVVLPAPFGPSSETTVPGLDAQVERVDGGEVAEALRQAFGFDRGAERW